MEEQMKKALFIVASLCSLGVLTSGCSSVDTALGKTKKSPDEFQVVVRPPLTLPPNFSLRPGDENEEVQSISSVDSVNTDAVSVSDQVLTSSRMGDGSVFDNVLGTENRVAGIRDLVDQETLGIQIDRRLPTDILFGGQPNVGPNLDAAKEAIRIRRALEEGTPINEGATLATDPIEKTPVEIK